MENTFSYEATLKRARDMARAKAAGQEIPKAVPPRRGKQPRSNFDFDTALRLTREKGGQRAVDEEFEA